MMVIAEAFGHALVIEAYGTPRWWPGPAASRRGDVATGLLENIVPGQAIVALTAAEAASGDRWQDAVITARRDGTEWVLDGAKIMAVVSRSTRICW